MDTRRLSQLFTIICAAAFVFSVRVTYAQGDLQLRTDIDRSFYQEYFKVCPECTTITVVVSQSPVGDDVRMIFREVAEQFGETHAVSVLDPRTYLVNYKVFRNNGCESITAYDSTFLVYIDRISKYCVKFPISSENHLLSVISIVSHHWKNPKAVAIEHKKFLANDIVKKYADKYEVVEPIQDALISFLEYVARQANEFYASKD